MARKISPRGARRGGARASEHRLRGVGVKVENRRGKALAREERRTIGGGGERSRGVRHPWRVRRERRQPPGEGRRTRRGRRRGPGGDGALRGDRARLRSGRPRDGRRRALERVPQHHDVTRLRGRRAELAPLRLISVQAVFWFQASKQSNRAGALRGLFYSREFEIVFGGDYYFARISADYGD